MKKSKAELESNWHTAEHDTDGLNRLEALVVVFEHFSHVYAEAIALARRQEYSWDDIAEVFDITRQSAWERFRDLED